MVDAARGAIETTEACDRVRDGSLAEDVRVREEGAGLGILLREPELAEPALEVADALAVDGCHGSPRPTIPPRPVAEADLDPEVAIVRHARDDAEQLPDALHRVVRQAVDQIDDGLSGLPPPRSEERRVGTQR